MSGEDHAQRDLLLQRIRTRRQSIAQFVEDLRPRGNRLGNISIVASALGAALTAGPALGGQHFTEGVQSAASLQNNSTVWQGLCIAAMVVTVISAVAAGMLKRQDSVTKISAAETCGAELESLQTALEFDQVSLEAAVNLYQSLLSRISFVPEAPPDRTGARPELPRPSRAVAEVLATHRGSAAAGTPPGPADKPHQPLVIFDDHERDGR